MPLTINYVGMAGHQQPARRYFDQIQDKISYTSEMFQHVYKPNTDRFVTEHFHMNGSCFVWSSNTLLRDAWIPMSCNFRMYNPFIVCEKKLKLNVTPVVYERPIFKCAKMFLEFNGFCIRIKLMNVRHATHKDGYMKPQLTVVLIRILTAWTIPLRTVQKKQELQIMKWFKNDNCECYVSSDITYIEIKKWFSKPCNCDISNKAIIMVKQIKSLIPSMLFSCDDGNFYHVINQCDGVMDCDGKEDESNCSHVCSTNVNCGKECLLPDCVCLPLYHQCTLGGCVQRSLVCDGVFNCVNDASDEMACSLLPDDSEYANRLIKSDVSLCNSFSNDTYPNNAICLLVRDRYEVTKHCPNTEHLHYCADFQCPNHYKCPESYCIPLHTVCDGVKDCPEGQDEEHCSNFTCRGVIRCKGMHVCLHPDYMCNGVIDCPVYGDDESFCDNLICPKQCECIGFTLSCVGVTLRINHYVSQHSQVKAIALFNCTVMRNSIRFDHFRQLQILDLSSTDFHQTLHAQNFTHMTQLRILDLTDTNINVVEGSRFTHMISLTHLHLVRTAASILRLESFQLPSLISLQLQQSGIQSIKNNAPHCNLPNLKLLNASFNNIKYIYVKTFMCLDGLNVLDLSNNQLKFIAKSALDNIEAVWFSEGLHKCCYAGIANNCQVNHRVISNADRVEWCQPILVQFKWMKGIYGVIGVTSTFLSITFIIKIYWKKEDKNNKVTTHVLAIACSDAFNGLYVILVFSADVFNEIITGNLVQEENIRILLNYIAAIPRASLITMRLEHVLMTLATYLATCYVFREFSTHIRLTRFISWVVCLSYCMIDFFLLRKITSRDSMNWQQYHMTVSNIKDVFSIVIVTVYEVCTFILMLLLCTRIYNSVVKSERRVSSATNSVKHNVVAKRLYQLTIGRLTSVLLSLALIALQTSHLKLAIMVQQVLTVLIILSLTIINFILFYNQV